MSTTASTLPSFINWFTKVLGIGRRDRPEELARMIAILDGMIGELDVTRKKVEDRQSYLVGKARDAGLKGDKESQQIYIAELEEIGKLLSIVLQAKRFLLQVKLRLETVVEMSDVLRTIPEVLSTLQPLKPMLARIAPDMVEKISELEKIAINIVSSTGLPNIYGKASPKEEVDIVKKMELEELSPPTNVPMEVIKAWLIEEVKSLNGIINLDIVSKKYNVSKEQIILALKELEREGRILIKT
ncbi:MAG: hypothetical protein N3E36_03670 [Sulfolobales archaeon]|nr:hypothetical protein [Sulfolobales archaeon]MCX8199112.1 hypothetical protein [Sulfolobales archaeon]MDW8170091.1 hypothetical protein [Desulfurococcaceae archaeon]